MTGYKLWDKKSSDIREQLGIFNTNDKVTQYKINWRETYKEWMATDCSTNFNYKTEGRKNIGRPQRRSGRWFLEGRNRPRGLSLLVDDDDELSNLFIVQNQDKQNNKILCLISISYSTF